MKRVSSIPALDANSVEELNPPPLNATARNGDVWTGERNGEYWIYRDCQNALYESLEVPVFRINLGKIVRLATCGELGCFHLYDLSGEKLTGFIPPQKASEIAKANGWTLCL